MDDAGRYHGVSTGTTHHVQSPAGLIVNPHMIDEQRRAGREAAGRPEDAPDERAREGQSGDLETGTGVGLSPHRTRLPTPHRTATPPLSAGPTRLATKALDPVRLIRDVSNIHDELISHFVAAGVPVNVYLEIGSEHLAEFDPAVVAALRENLRQLGFDGRPE